MRADAIAGAIGAIIVLPQGVALATIAGMPPEYGLYAAMVPAIVAALFGSSWHLVSGPTTAISIVVFASVSPMAEPGTAQYVSLVLTLTFLVGVFQLAMGLARMGTLVNFMSHTVVIGFTAGAGILIIATQLGNFFAIAIPRGASFADTVVRLATGIGAANPWAVAVGALTLASGVIAKRVWPRIPYMIVALLTGSVAAWLFERYAGDGRTGIAMVGALPAGLPPLSHPDFSLEGFKQVSSSAVAITMLALTEATSIARAIAVRTGQRIDGNQEFVGQGLANVAGSFFSAYPSSGSFNRSGLNHEAGARTPLAAVFASILLVAILYAVAPLAARLPIPAMAAILFLVGWSLIDVHHARMLVRTSRQETAVLSVTFLATLFVHLEIAIYFGVIVSLMLYLNRASTPSVIDIKPDPAEGSYHFSADTGLPDCPQLKMVRVNGSVFFGAVDHVDRAFRAIDAQDPGQVHLMVAATGINFVDVAGAELLAREAERRRTLGGGLYFHRVKDEVRAVLDRGGYTARIGPDALYAMKGDIMPAIYARLDPAVCRTCTVRIFRQCRARLPDGTLRHPDDAPLARAQPSR